MFIQGGEVHSSCEVLPADEASSYGLRPYAVICDELSVWPDTGNARGLWSAVVSAMPKVRASRLIVLTSAGSPDHWSAGVLDHARTSSQWQVFEVAGPLPWLTDAVLAEQRALLTPSMYARLHENRWVAGEDRLTTPEQVRDCIGHRGPIAPQRGVRYVHGLDVGLVSDRTVLTTAHSERRDGAVIVVVDRQEVWQGTKSHPVDLGDVEAYCRETVRSYPGKIIADPWQSVHLCQCLRSRGIGVETFTFSSSSVGHLALTMYRLLRDRLLDLPDDDDLVAELSSVILRENQPGTYRIDTVGQGHDDRVISLALCCQKLASQYSGVAKMHIPQGRLPQAQLVPPRSTPRHGWSRADRATRPGASHRQAAPLQRRPQASRLHATGAERVAMTTITSERDLVAAIGVRPDWLRSAACAGFPAAIFYPTQGQPTAPGKEVCRGCVVRADCLEYALSNGEKVGIWGGTSERQRRRIRMARNAARVA